MACIVVNAATHRDYRIMGTDIQIKMIDDRLEVDSPGTFAGMVKKENIRYTHFSRNPKIAAFLKDYGYVKEYGEGVDRMCRELEAIGLPDPCFNNDTFILKTTVKSADWDCQSTQNARIKDKNAGIEGQNARIGSANPCEDAKNAWIEYLLQQKGKKEITVITADAIISVITDYRENQIIGSIDIQKILHCRESKALRIVNEMKKRGIIQIVSGHGKGKYILTVPSTHTAY